MKDGIFLTVMLILVVLIVGILIVGLATPVITNQQICKSNEDRSQACIDWRFDQCMATERYSREECILLVAGRK